MNTYIIESIDTPTLYWGGQYARWSTRREAAIVFNEDRRASYSLPRGGCWVLVSQPEPPPASFLHLKTPTAGHDHNAPTLCGRDDPGLYAYASATSAERVAQLREESKTEPYPLCPACDAAYFAPAPESIVGATELLPCPFCGVQSSGGEFGPGPYLSRSQVSKFKSVICSGCCSIASGETESRVIERWNTRVASPEREQVIKQLVEAIEAEASRQAMKSGLGVSEWKAFVWTEARNAITAVDLERDGD